MWSRRTDADGAGSAVPTAPFEVVLGLGFVALLVLGAVFSAVPAARHDGLVLLCVAAAAIAWRASLPAIAVSVPVTWLFYLSTVVGPGAGEVNWPGTGRALVALALLATSALVVVVARRVLAVPARRQALHAAARSTAALFYPALRRQPADDLVEPERPWSPHETHCA
jgi:hypothetical protein